MAVPSRFLQQQSSTRFHCPVYGCLYSDGSERFFTSRKLLNQHHTKVHAEKKYGCSKCHRMFGVESLLRHHEASCGIEWKCLCGSSYSSREALLTHARRTEHDLPIEIAKTPQKKKPSGNVQIQQVIMPVVVVIQQPPPQQQQSTLPTAIPSPVPTATKHRQILPKSSHAVATRPVPTTIFLKTANESSEPATGSNELLLPTEYVQINIDGTTGMAGPSQGPQSNNTTPRNREQLQVPNSGWNIAKSESSCQIHFPSHPFPVEGVGTGKGVKRQRQQAAAETQTALSDVLRRALESAHLPVVKESRASQCSPRPGSKVRRHSTRSTSIHTQTTESTFGRIKKSEGGRSSGTRLRRSSVATTTELSNTAASLLDEQSAKALWCSIETMLFGKNETVQPWEGTTLRSSSSTQTSPRSSFCKDFCDSQTITEEELFGGALSVIGDLDPVLQRASDKNWPCIGEVLGRPEDELLTVLPDSEIVRPSPLEFPSTENSLGVMCSDNVTDFMVDGGLSPEAQMDVALRDFLPDNTSQQSVQTDFDDEAFFNDIQTQTSEDIDFDSMLANMETQTVDDFFPDLGFSDIQTQTSWHDLELLDSLDESCLLKPTSQLSLEIQTGLQSPMDISEFPCVALLKPSTTHTETQTYCSQATTLAPTTSSYAQTGFISAPAGK